VISPLRHCSNKLILGDRKRFEPRIDGFWIGIRKIIVKLVCSSFYLLKDTFDRISVAVCYVPKMHAEFMETSMQPWSPIDVELGVVNIVFLCNPSRNHFVETVVLVE